MTLAFLAPAFLIGMALISVPWIIHHIRRPEREPLKFSSLMFIPKITKEIIERRRLQHLLLLALRMLLLLLLALAFARPYWKAPLDAGAGGRPSRHIVAIDASFSMQALDRFGAAKEKALGVIEKLSPEDRVGVVVFDSAPRLAAPLIGGGEAKAAESKEEKTGTKEAAKIAVQGAVLGEESTAYLPALKMAQEQLMAGDAPDEENPETLIVHLVSDFQRGGLPEKPSGWRLSPRVTLDLIDVGQDGLVNQSITDLSVRKTSEGDLRLQAKIKNWSDQEQPNTELRLVVGDEVKERKTLSVKPGNATQAAFALPIAGAQRIEGRLEIASDVLPLDDKRQFVWSVPQKKQAILVADDQPDQRWPAALFIQRALPKADNLPWELTTVDQAGLGQKIEVEGAIPDVLIAADLRGLNEDAARVMLDYVRKGGQLLIALNSAMEAEKLNTGLLGVLGLKSLGLRREAGRRTGYELLTWIDFEHPAFALFQGARYNDFSQIQFFNHHLLDAASEGPKSLARFEADDKDLERPAIVESKLGEGRGIVWAFGLDLPTTNLCKNIKFVPLLLETISYLGKLEDARQSWTVGEIYPKRPFPRGAEGALKWIFRSPEGADATIDGDGLAQWKAPRLSKSGFARWKMDGQPDWLIVDAVNLDPAESNLARIPVAEFEMKVASGLAQKREAADAAALPEGFTVKREYWRWLVGFMFAFLLVECWYASRLLR